MYIWMITLLKTDNWPQKIEFIPRNLKGILYIIKFAVILNF